MSGAPLAPRRPWQGRRVLLGVTGGIAAYKSVQIARDLTRLGAHVDVILTRAAREFVGPLSFEGVTGRPVQHDILDEGNALSHIRLARDTDVVCVAPATADFIARAAAGRADDLLTAVLLATESPVIVCPAMNDRMYAHPQTQANVAHLRDKTGYIVVGPGVGPLAWNEGEGPGRLEDVEIIVEHVGRALEQLTLVNTRIVVTAGPTREALDPVRFLSNRSSGKMGFAIAQSAWRRGAEVVLITGPSSLASPPGVQRIDVESAEEMRAAVQREIRSADALVMAAAVADFRPSATATSKIKKNAAPSSLELEPTPDVLASTISDRAKGLVVIGFALETDNVEANARAKLESKRLEMIVLNDARNPQAGFDVDTNQVVLISRDGVREQLPVMSKSDVAEQIVERLTTLITSR